MGWSEANAMGAPAAIVRRIVAISSTRTHSRAGANTGTRWPGGDRVLPDTVTSDTNPTSPELSPVG